MQLTLWISNSYTIFEPKVSRFGMQVVCNMLFLSQLCPVGISAGVWMYLFFLIILESNKRILNFPLLSSSYSS